MLKERGSLAPKSKTGKLSLCDLTYEEVNIQLVDDNGKPTFLHGYNSAILEQIVSCGYPISFIIDSLQSEQLNHVTAFYSLATT